MAWRLLIDGELVEAADGRTGTSLDPGSGHPVADYVLGGAAEVDAAVAAARRAFDHGPWPGLTPAARAGVLIELADLVQARVGPLAQLEARDSGGLVARTAFDVVQGGRFLRRMARYAATEFPWRESLPAGSPLFPSRNYVRREPIGVCAAIVPWNFPLLLALWKLTMALATGNTLVLKPAPETPLSALLLAEIVRSSRVPPGVVNIVTGPGGETGERLVSHPQVDRVAFTGSTATGRRVMAAAAGTIKRVSLELGGKSANLILEDADLDLAVDGALYAAFLHAGQVCEAGTRLLVPRRLAPAITAELVARMGQMRLGYQLHPDTNVGPLISAARHAAVGTAISDAVSAGARLVAGGRNATVAGYEGGHYLEPALFTDVDPTMAIAREEVFGPVLALLPYDTEEEAVALANGLPYGLAAGVWSRSVDRAETVAAGLRAGTVWINDWHVFHEFGPFGGYGQSGVGRELGRQGLESYTEVKHVHVGTEGDPDARPGHRTLRRRPPPTGYEYTAPVRVISGPGSVARLAGVELVQGPTRYLLITDAGVRDAGVLGPVTNALGHAIVAVYDEVPQDSGLAVVDAAAAAGRQAGVNAVLSIGGGSVIDTGKAVALSLGLGTPAAELLGMNHLSGRRLAHVAIPTTAGTGSEVTDVIVLRDERLGRKSFIKDQLVVPDLAILDPTLTLSLPPRLTAATAMDALTHAIEAYTSRKANPITDAHALHAIALIATHLPTAVARGDDLAARSALLAAANLAGFAIAGASVGLVHALGHAVTARCGVPHGTVNGILLPHLIRWNAAWPTVAARCGPLAVALGAAEAEVAADPAEAAAVRVEELLRRTDHPVSLADVGVTREALAGCVELAMVDPAAWNAPRPLADPAAALQLYHQAWASSC